MHIIQTVILGIIEGVTEFLPISSTAHILLAERIMGITAPESFTIGIQLGAIFAALLISLKYLTHIRVWKLVVVGAIPTVVLGAVLYPVVKTIHENLIVIALALILGGIIMIIWPLAKDTKPASESLENISYKHSFIIGLIQALSFIPGVSRSAATIYAGSWLRIRVNEIVRFSFLLAVPVMTAATAFSFYKEFKAHALVNYDWGMFSIGVIVSAAVAYGAMSWLLAFIQKHSWKYFGWYRICIGLLLFAFYALHII